MSYDRYSTTHHLTNDGWTNDDERPSNAIETWVCRVYQPSEWSKEDRDWYCTWANPEVDRATRDAVRAMFKDKIGMIPGTLGNVRVSVGEPL